MCGLLRLRQLQAASTAVTTAALIFDGMAGTLQRREQCLTGLEFEAAPRGDKCGIRHGALMVGPLQAEAIQITGVHLAVDLADQIGADLHLLRRDLHIVGAEPGVDPGQGIGFVGEGRG